MTQINNTLKKDIEDWTGFKADPSRGVNINSVVLERFVNYAAECLKMREERRELVEAANKCQGNEWLYRPNEHDDWGIIRSEKGHIVAVSRGVERVDFDQCRKDKTDPYKKHGTFISMVFNTVKGWAQDERG